MPARRLSALVFALACTLATAALAAGGLTARLDTGKVAIGGTVQLTLSADPAQLTAAPDISPLSKDFDILGTSQSSQTRVVNGARSDSVEWSITLAPRAKGQLTIPPIHAGQASSAALNLDVVDAADLPSAPVAEGGTAITATVAPGTHYVQQEIPLTLRITVGAGLRDARITPPASANYVLEQQGKDRIRQENTQSGPVTVVERDYLLRPQTSGTLTVAPFTLTGTVADLRATSPFGQDPLASFFGNTPFGGAGSPFGRMFGAGRPVTLRSAPLTVEIKPKPAGSAGWFLPAKSVSLSASWDPAHPTFRVGEAVTRHIRLQAVGATGVQLPDLAQPEVTGARVYLDSSDLGTVDTADGSAAVRDFSYSIVPTSGGTITLPAVTVNWFDTASETPRTATLPAETITAAGPVAPASPEATQGTTRAVTPANAAPATAGGTARALRVLALCAVSVAAIAALILFWQRYRGQADTSHDPASSLSDNRVRASALGRVRDACATDDPGAAYAATLAWLQAVARDSHVSPDAILRQSPDLDARWQDLEARRFSGAAMGPWDAREFLAAVNAADKATRKRAGRDAATTLPPLYADTAHGV